MSHTGVLTMTYCVLLKYWKTWANDSAPDGLVFFAWSVWRNWGVHCVLGDFHTARRPNTPYLVLGLLQGLVAGCR